MPNIWVVRADAGEYARAFQKGKFAGIGWASVGDLTDIAEKSSLTDIYERQADPREGKLTRSTNINTIWRFADEIQVDDWVLTPQKERRYLQYGRVDGTYHWVEQPDDDCPYRHRRSVQWSPHPLDRHSLSFPFQRTLGSALTVFNVRHLREFAERSEQTQLNPNADSGEQPVRHPKKPYELAIDRILNLSPTDFEHLVGHLLSAIGFEIEVTPSTNDRGVDFRGTLNISNAAQVDIIGQVKRYKHGSNINRKAIMDLRGRIPTGQQGTFVTTSDYTKRAREIAEQDGFSRVGLINGEQLVDLLTQHWLEIPDEFREELDLKPILVPA